MEYGFLKSIHFKILRNNLNTNQIYVHITAFKWVDEFVGYFRALKLCCEETSTRIFEHYHEHHIIIFVVRIKKAAYPDAQVRTISEPQDFFGRSENDCTIAVPNCGSRRRPWPCPFGAYIFEPSPNINTHSL